MKTEATLQRYLHINRTVGKVYGRLVLAKYEYTSELTFYRRGPTPEQVRKGLEEFRIEVMQRLGLPANMTWVNFFCRTQEEIDP